ncbi:NAD(P)H-quinone oxidoreductase [Methylicorpusculum sp.]|uniref:NAD(P)H-quinone oxidoreductase n=1 Tax=Methylicorpusculum sp. TaxID=2713644 RepID=UPI00272F05DC|nr:NAD(P)H-quinone oxidoreductase [Methylicorpusculum sp.]MDP2178532.1 NAD(P)H-quinone oxidoreductase [Methylicorpusculum sp.]MDP3530141.1 NAD(P)H-quinone oxidoreductase [Methylicorpusculum sp.]MDZ4150348.1 NAD(P)H-quinone oxidoreductase [Methylicorpusculum sp.]
MIAIGISEFGSFDALKPVNRPVPTPAPNEVLIKVAAAGVNRPDIMQRQGAYPPPPGASDIPGLEIAGTVVRIGSAVNQPGIGSEVCALVLGGGYAEYCLAPAELCLPIPVGFNMIQAAALPETFFTVWSNVFDRAQLNSGETLLVHGGTSGIGTTAIQLANAFGAKIIVTAGSDDKCAFCVELGADSAINYRTRDFVEDVLLLTDDQGVDVVLDMIGGDYFARNLKCLTEEGRLVQIAIQNGAKVELNLWHLMAKRLTLTGSTLRSRDIPFKAAIAGKLKQQVWPLLETGKIRPVIHAHFPLTKAYKAHELMESSQHIGKIILTV